MSTRPPIALTTIFTPPPTCLSTITYDGTWFWQNEVNQTGDPDCYPPFFSNIFNSCYSPGICPHSWTSAGSIVAQGVTVNHDGPLGAEFNAMCCPSGFKYSRTTLDQVRHFCASLFTTDLTNFFSTSTLQTAPLPTDATVTKILAANVSRNTIFADVIQIRWQSTDIQVLQLLGSATTGSVSITATPSATTAVASQTLTSTPLNTTTPTSSPSSSTYNGISTGTKVGIGVAGPLAVMAMLLTIFLYRRRRRKTKPATGPEISISSAYLPIHGDERQYPAAEMDARRVQELANPTQVPELPSTAVKAELPSNSLGRV